jgi:hypothetical protein
MEVAEAKRLDELHQHIHAQSGLFRVNSHAESWIEQA